MPSRLQRVVNWLREGYPQGIPDTDFVPLFALLRRRLSEEEARELAAELVAKGLIAPDKIDVAVGYLRITDQLPCETELARVIDRLRESGWDVRPGPFESDDAETEESVPPGHDPLAQGPTDADDGDGPDEPPATVPS